MLTKEEKIYYAEKMLNLAIAQNDTYKIDLYNYVLDYLRSIDNDQ